MYVRYTSIIVFVNAHIGNRQWLELHGAVISASMESAMCADEERARTAVL